MREKKVDEKYISIKEAAAIIGCSEIYLQVCAYNRIHGLIVIPHQNTQLAYNSVIAFKKKYKPRKKKSA